MDDSAALAEPGVLAVITHANAPWLASDDPELAVLQSAEVSWREQVVAAVVAETIEVARYAAGLVRVTYEELPHDTEMRYDEDALEKPGPHVGLFGTIDGERARITFLDPASRKLFTDWESKAYDVVGQLRLGVEPHTDDSLLASLIGELSIKSGDFRRLWAAHDVKKKTHGGIRLSHPLVGELTLCYETLALPGDQEQSLSTYHAKPGSPSEESLRLLASWGADASQEWTASTSH